MFYWADFLRTSGPGGSLSDALRDGSEEVREEPRYIGVLQGRPGSRNIKRLLLKKTRYIGLINLAFSMYGRCKSLGSLKLFLWYTPLLSRASILCFSILSALRMHSWGLLQWLMAWQWAACLSPSWAPSWLDGRSILCLLIWQATFFIHKTYEINAKLKKYGLKIVYLSKAVLYWK